MMMTTFTVVISTINAELAKDKRVYEELMRLDVEAEGELEAVHEIAGAQRKTTYPLLRNEGTVISYKIARETGAEVVDATQNS